MKEELKRTGYLKWEEIAIVKEGQTMKHGAL
jgi:hypothetical protein